MSDVWVLTKEEGSYSDYNMAVLAIASSAERAKELADDYVQHEYDTRIAHCTQARASWPEAQRQHELSGYWAKTAEQAHPTPKLQILTWEPNPDRPGDWHFGDCDERWTIFSTSLDALAPDGCLNW